MERREEQVVEAEDQCLQHRLTDSHWNHLAVLEQAALETDRWLGELAESGLFIDESGFAKMWVSGPIFACVALNIPTDNPCTPKSAGRIPLR
jgi:hypothetical protein